MKHIRHTLVAATALSLSVFTALPATAQIYTNREMSNRVEKLERDLLLLQRQAARGGIDSGTVTPGAGSASLEVRLTEIEDEMRKLRGQLEENDYKIRRLSDDMKRFQEDVEFRLNEQSSVSSPAQSAPANDTEVSLEGDMIDKPIDTAPPANGLDSPAAPEETSAGDGTLTPPTQNTNSSFATPRDHYNQAFRLLNQTKYAEAAKLFQSFTKKHPKDPLIGNAYYWLGETHYIRSDYVSAADNFREGFEVLPKGPKAADNLLKLSMSLSALNKTDDACIVLDQLLLKFRESSTAVAQKAEQEHKRIGCSA